MDWKETAEKLNRVLKLRVPPVGLKLFKDAEEMAAIEGLRRPRYRLTFCQVIEAARTRDWIMGAGALQLYPMCSGFIGLRKVPERIANGEFQCKAGVFETLEDSKASQDCRVAIPSEFKGVAVAPLAPMSNKLEPDLIIIGGTPGQIGRLFLGVQWSKFRQLVMTFSGEGSLCSDGIARCWITGNPTVAALLTGSETRYAHFSDIEETAVFPAGEMERILVGLERTENKGIKWPPAAHGPIADPEKAFVRETREILDEEIAAEEAAAAAEAE